MSDFKEFEEELIERAEDSEPSFEKIAVKECGCRCGVKDCEFAGDFFTEEGLPTEEFGSDEDLLEEGADAVSVNAIDNGYGDFKQEFAEELSAADERGGEFSEELVEETEDYNEFSEELTQKGDMSVNEGPITGEIEYRETADFRMIDPDGEAFDTMGS